MKNANTTKPINQADGVASAVDADDERAAMELSSMISELNEVRMRLDSVVRKIGVSAAEALMEAGSTGPAGPTDSAIKFRLKMVDQLDRIREKLVLRARSLHHS
jgi:hypothetical protein